MVAVSPIMHHHKILLAYLWHCVLYSQPMCVLLVLIKNCVCIHEVLIDVCMVLEVFIALLR